MFSASAQHGFGATSLLNATQSPGEIDPDGISIPKVPSTFSIPIEQGVVGNDLVVAVAAQAEPVAADRGSQQNRIGGIGNGLEDYQEIPALPGGINRFSTGQNHRNPVSAELIEEIFRLTVAPDENTDIPGPYLFLSISGSLIGTPDRARAVRTDELHDLPDDPGPDRIIGVSFRPDIIIRAR